jgi:hypothetical protein
MLHFHLARFRNAKTGHIGCDFDSGSGIAELDQYSSGSRSFLHSHLQAIHRHPGIGTESRLLGIRDLAGLICQLRSRTCLSRLTARRGSLTSHAAALEPTENSKSSLVIAERVVSKAQHLAHYSQSHILYTILQEVLAWLRHVRLGSTYMTVNNMHSVKKNTPSM